jgi:single-strand DNA-binding protein
VIVTGRLDQRSWETEQGEKRSVVEVVADEVGPSLRWATATIQKNERSERSASAGGGGDAWGGGQPAPAGEEPFVSADPFLIWEQI